MQPPAEMTAFGRVASIERLVNSARGVRTPDLYSEMKYFAINKDSDWRPAVHSLTECATLDCVEWCGVFISDILIIRKLAETLEQRATRLADLAAPVGSRQHAEAKLQLLLARGEDAVTQSNVCEDVLLRALQRMLVLAEWGYTVSLAFLVCLRGALHSKTTSAVLVTGLHTFAPSPYRQTDEGMQ